MAAQDLANTVDPMTGQARYALPLLTYPGRGGLDLSLSAAYSSGMLATATRWNLDAPTGVLGLGWGIASGSIQLLLDGGSAVGGDRTYVMNVAGVSSPLVCIAENDDGTSSWAAVNYVFWLITYDPAQELWTVVDTDGLTRLFGGAASGRGTVDWGVCWRDWTALNGAAAGAAAMATGWSLSAVVNLFGDRIVYSYDQTSVEVLPMVGSPTFTRETVLTQITGVDGSRIELAYAPKSASEYQDPCTDPVPPNGGQDRYPTQYLTQATLYSAAGTALEAVQFGYAATLLGSSSSMGKRLLTSVTRLNSSGAATAPPTQFAYWGQGSSDGVTASSVSSGSALYGALMTVTLPSGGTLSFNYLSMELSYADRSRTLSGTSGWTQPVVRVCDSQVLVTWLSGTSVILQSFIWSGRWIATTIATASLGSVAYSAVQVAAGVDCCALLVGTSLTLAHRDPSQAGGWLTSQGFTVTLSGAESATLAAGRGFAAVLGVSSGTLSTYRFTGTGAGTANFIGGWTADTAVVLGGTAQAGDQFALAAQGALFTAAKVPSGSNTASLWLYQRTALGTWSSVTGSLELAEAATAGIGLWMGSGFAVVMAARAVPGLVAGSFGGLWWTGDAETLCGQVWTTQTAATVAALPVPVIAGATVGIGSMVYRFTGGGWIRFNANDSSYADVDGPPVLSVGSDLVARSFSTTDDGTITDLLVYDPLSGAWQVPDQSATDDDGNALKMSFTDQSAIAVASSSTGTAANYAVIAGQLWYRSPDQSWSSVTTVWTPATDDDPVATRLMADRYLALQWEGANDAVETQVFLLQNGSAAAAMSSPLDNAQILLPNGTAGSLVGPYGFAAYEGDWGDAGGTLTLYQPIGNDVTDSQTGYAVASVTAVNGYQNELYVNGSFSAAFSYAQGTIDPTGSIPFFNTVTVVPGATTTTNPANGTTVTAFYNGLTDGETPATAYPSTTTADDHGLTVLGTVYQQAVNKTNSNGSLIEIAGTSLIQTVFQRSLGTAGIGYYARQTAVTATLDGVSQTSTANYVTSQGENRCFPVSATVQTYNSAGTIDSWTTTYTYFPDEYEPAQDINLLSPVVQRVVTSLPAGASTASTIAIDIVTWRDWSDGQDHWAPNQSYRGLNATAVFNSWDPDDTPPADDDFMLVGTVLDRTPQGLPLAVANALGTPCAIHYNLNLTFPVASAANADPADFVWYGCEPYESSAGWTSSAAGLTIQDYITTDDFHTGTQCLALPAGSSKGPMLSVVPADQTRSYVFSCWARTASAFSPAGGTAQWTITPYNPSTGAAISGIQAITLTLTPTSGTPTAVGGWAYFQVTIDLPALVSTSKLSAVGLSLVATNNNTAQLCYLDELRFAPLDCAFSAAVYAPNSLLTTATINNNGQPAIAVYDMSGRPSVQVGPNGRITQIAQAGFALWAANPTGKFNTALPNSVVTLTTPEASSFQDFHALDSTGWTFSSANWEIGSGQLSYTTGTVGATFATAEFDGVSDINLAATVTVTTAPTDGAAVALGNGTYSLCWTSSTSDGAGTWTLLEWSVSGTATTLATNSVAAYQPNWLFAIIDGMVLCYASGTPLFCYEIPGGTTAESSIVLRATGDTGFDNLAVLADPMLSWAALDGLGTSFYNLSMLGYQPDEDNPLYPGKWTLTAAPTLQDSLGRPQYIGQSLLAPVQQWSATTPVTTTGYSLLAMDQPSYLVDFNGNSVSIQSYETGTNGLTCGQLTYETSPLSRIVMQGGPRNSWASGTNYCTMLTNYGACTAADGSTVTGETLKYGTTSQQALQQSQSVPTATAPSVTVLSQTVRDTLGRILQIQSGPTGGTLLTTGYAYDNAGRLSTIYLPNAYPLPTIGTTPWVESYAYDFLGRLTSRTTPDTGTTQWALDNLGRVRFVLDANGAAQTPPCITYFKYDALNRMTEGGYIQDASWTWATVQGKVNDTAFPAIGAAATNPDAASGKIGVDVAYDTDGEFSNAASFTRFLLGRPVDVTITPTDNATGADVESYSYDAFGNTLTKTVVMPGISPAAGWTTGYSYDALNRVTAITYPDMTATAQTAGTQTSLVTVGYGYDRLGRMAAVGGAPTGAVIDPDNPPLDTDRSYAGYSFNIFGQLETALYNNTGNGPAITRTFSYDDCNQWLTGISDGYLTETINYSTGSNITGWTYFGQLASSIESDYGCDDTSWSDALCCYSQTFAYDGYGRLSSASNDLGAAFALTMGTGGAGYDNNGNIQGKTRGITKSTYAYATNAGVVSNDRVLSITSTASAVVDFTAASPVLNGWTWGSANDGPTTSSLTTTTPVGDGTQALMLAGGSVSHYEQLQLATYVMPGIAYTLTWTVATGSTYPDVNTAAASGAAWYAILNAAYGPVGVVRLATIQATASTWQTGSASLDLTETGIEALVGMPAELVSVTVELRNLCTGTNGAAGAAVYVQNAGFAMAGTKSVVSSYTYDNSGNITAAPASGLTKLSYDPGSGLTGSITLGGAIGSGSIAYEYSGSAQRSRSTLTLTAAGSSTASTTRTVTLTGLNGEILATQTVLNGGTPAVTYYVNGADGPLAVTNSAGNATYLLTDRLGTPRISVTGSSGDVVAAFDTMPFGSLQQATGTPVTDLGFAGQWLNVGSGLYDDGADLYDPELSRFFSAAPIISLGSPYSFAGNDPVNWIWSAAKTGTKASTGAGSRPGSANMKGVGFRDATNKAFGFETSNERKRRRRDDDDDPDDRNNNDKTPPDGVPKKKKKSPRRPDDLRHIIPANVFRGFLGAFWNRANDAVLEQVTQIFGDQRQILTEWNNLVGNLVPGPWLFNQAIGFLIPSFRNARARLPLQQDGVPPPNFEGSILAQMQYTPWLMRAQQDIVGNAIDFVVTTSFNDRQEVDDYLSDILDNLQFDIFEGRFDLYGYHLYVYREMVDFIRNPQAATYETFVTIYNLLRQMRNPVYDIM